MDEYVTDDFIRGMFYSLKLARGEAKQHLHNGNIEGAIGAQAVEDKIYHYMQVKKSQQDKQ